MLEWLTKLGRSNPWQNRAGLDEKAVGLLAKDLGSLEKLDADLASDTTLGIEAVLEFTGNGLPEQNRTVALTTLHFERVAAEGEPANPGAKMALGEMPPVLLSECWNDIRQIAAEGSGFDPDWEKKTQA
jgi:hypothetical protein